MYDAVFNDDVVKQAVAYRKLKVFLVELVLQWVGQKYKLSLDPKYKLPHRKYMAGVVSPLDGRVTPDHVTCVRVRVGVRVCVRV